MRLFPFIRVCAILSIVLLGGCALSTTEEIHDPADLPPNVGLDTLPIYEQYSGAFDTKLALQKAENERRRELQDRIQHNYPNTNIPDPWIPPDPTQSEELMRALRYFPKDPYGNPDWTTAVQKGVITPKGALLKEDEKDEYKRDYERFKEAMSKVDPEKAPTEKFEDLGKYSAYGPFDLNIVFRINDRLMFNVLFPHKIHSYWLPCTVCHPKIFIPRKGANIFSMYDIWNGQYCGRCHGKVAFMPKGFLNCERCHKVGKKTMGIQ
jgi:c(7)-type cytochrome triheme protein